MGIRQICWKLSRVSADVFSINSIAVITWEEASYTHAQTASCQRNNKSQKAENRFVQLVCEGSRWSRSSYYWWLNLSNWTLSVLMVLHLVQDERNKGLFAKIQLPESLFNLCLTLSYARQVCVCVCCTWATLCSDNGFSSACKENCHYWGYQGQKWCKIYDKYTGIHVMAAPTSSNQITI